MKVEELIIPELDSVLEEPILDWTFEQEELMRKYYPGLAKRRKVNLLAEKLNRPVTQVYSKAQRMGL